MSKAANNCFQYCDSGFPGPLSPGCLGGIGPQISSHWGGRAPSAVTGHPGGTGATGGAVACCFATLVFAVGIHSSALRVVPATLAGFLLLESLAYLK